MRLASEELNLTFTHVLAFIDNSTAESVNEFGRASTEGLHELNERRQRFNVEQKLHQASERVASVDNDIADLLSRGDVEEAPRFARDAGLEQKELELSAAERSLDGVPTTWDRAGLH